MALRRSPRIKELHVRRRDLSLRRLAEKAAIKIKTLEDELSASRAENVALSTNLKKALEARPDDAAGPMEEPAPAPRIIELEDEVSALRAENVALSTNLKEALEARADDAAGPMAEPAPAPANATTAEPLPNTWASKVFGFIQGHVPNASKEDY